MTLSNTLVNDLIRAANEVDRLEISECRRLFERAAIKVLGLRQQSGVIRSPSPGPADPLSRWLATVDVPTGSKAVKAAMLEAVEVIRIGERLVEMRAENGRK